MSTILETIFEIKRQRVEEAKRSINAADLISAARRIRSNAAPHRLRDALSDSNRLNIIAEFKKASPSKGLINDSRDIVSIAKAYEDGGACAMSILTEEDHFNGSLDDLRVARRSVSLPLLRKDFIFDDFQIYEAAAAGADAILLIVAGLSRSDMSALRSVAEDDLKMDALVEVHTAEEMEIAKSIGARLIGVNNRNLKSFEVSLDASRELVSHAPMDAILVAESGLRTREELLELRDLGYSGFLMGETLMRSDDPTVSLKNLISESVK